MPLFSIARVSTFTDCNGQYPSIPNAPLPADGPGNDSFSNKTLFGVLFAVPFYLRYKVGGGWKTFIFFTLLTSVPILIGYWTIKSRFSPRRNEKVKLPGKPIENYLEFHKKEDALQFKGKAKIPMETFHEMYFEGDVSFKGDCLEVMEYRHDWASFEFTLSLFKFFLTGMIPEMLIHSRSQGMYIFHMQIDLSSSVLKKNVQTRNRFVTIMTAVMISTVGFWVRV